MDVDVVPPTAGRSCYADSTEASVVSCDLAASFHIEQLIYIGRDKVLLAAQLANPNEQAQMERHGATGRGVVIKMRPAFLVGAGDAMRKTTMYPHIVASVERQRTALAALQRGHVPLLGMAFEFDWRWWRQAALGPAIGAAIKRNTGVDVDYRASLSKLPKDARYNEQIVTALEGDAVYIMSLGNYCKTSMDKQLLDIAKLASAIPGAAAAARALLSAIGSYVLQVVAQLHLCRAVMPDFNHGDLFPRNVILCPAPAHMAKARVIAYQMVGGETFYAPLLLDEAGDAMVWRITDMDSVSGTYTDPATGERTAFAMKGAYDDVDALLQFAASLPNHNALRKTIGNDAIWHEFRRGLDNSMLASKLVYVDALGKPPDRYATLLRECDFLRGGDDGANLAVASGALFVVLLPDLTPPRPTLTPQ